MKVRIELTYKTPKGMKTSFNSDTMNAEDAILITEDLEKTGRVKSIKFVDHRDGTWSVKELKEFVKGIQTEPHDITVYFDGGFDLETRHSGLGCSIYYKQNGKSYRLRKNSLIEELQTNNEAEYAALYLAIDELEQLGVHHLPVQFIGDSQVVINQMKDEWACFEEALTNWADRIENKIKKLGIEPEYLLVTRKENKEADKLATQALQGVEIISTTEK